jgi:glutamate synthase domain-containing protein 3
MEMVLLDTIDEEEQRMLKQLIKDHKDLTNSDVAAHILSYWPTAFQQFIKVMPVDYKAVLDKKKKESKAILN